MVVNLPDRPPGYYDGCEIRFTSGDLKGERSRVVESTPSTATTTLKVWPEFHTIPTAADTATVTDVPNIPAAYHHALAQFIKFKALQREGAQDATLYMSAFLALVEEAVQKNRPAQEQRFHRVRETPVGEEDWWS
jgi:hypothetical protein